MRTTVRETLFSNVMLDPNRQREMVFYGRVSTHCLRKPNEMV